MKSFFLGLFNSKQKFLVLQSQNQQLELGETLGKNCIKTRRNRRNTERNTQKQNGERQEMVWKLGKHIIEGITITITQKTI